MKQVTVNGYAKINPVLNIKGRYQNGYHEVDMLMNTLELHDTVEMEAIPEGIETVCEGAELPAGEGNIAWRAAALMQETFPEVGGVRIRIQKRIPVAAGLAGGSADAAAVLEGMAALYLPGLSKEKLIQLAPRLGADVAFSLMKGTARAQGIGEVLTGLSPLPRLWTVLVKPDVAVSTKEVYERYDAQEAVERREVEKALSVLESGLFGRLQEVCFNVLEPVTVKLHPEIRRIEEMMKAYGPLLCQMSGSGPTVFALFDDRKAAGALYHACKQQWDTYDVILTATYDGVSVLSTDGLEELC